MRLLERRPSPSMVVALIGLVVALTGTGVAGEVAQMTGLDKREKRQISRIAKKVANKRITQRAPRLTVARAATADTANVANSATTAKSADSADTAKSADTANSAATLTSQAWAVVNAAGALVRSGGGIVSASPLPGTGRYLVAVNRNVAGCAYQVSIEGSDPGDTDNGEVSANPWDSDPNAVVVGTFGPTGTAVAEGFMLLITC